MAFHWHRWTGYSQRSWQPEQRLLASERWPPTTETSDLCNASPAPVQRRTPFFSVSLAWPPLISACACARTCDHTRAIDHALSACPVGDSDAHSRLL
jgi:hypothetical protein